jgi:restriction endonuclease S subunit
VKNENQKKINMDKFNIPKLTPMIPYIPEIKNHKLAEVFMNLNQYATGTARPGLSVMNLNPIEIYLPSFEEQKKIVAEIQKIEIKIAELEKQIADIPQQKEKILKKYLN